LVFYPHNIAHELSIIETEDFDFGGEGVAYHDVSGKRGEVEK
jgi:hypothetical protein